MNQITIADIARAAGCSKPVVSKVLHDRGGNTRVSAATRDRVIEVAKELGYRPNAAARSMATNRSGHVGVLVPNTPGNPFTHPAGYEIVTGANTRLHELGMSTILANVDDIRQGIDQLRLFREHLVDGMMVLGNVPLDLVPRIEELVEHCVWIDTNVWRHTCCLRRDEHFSGLQATQLAITAGYRKLVLFTYPDNEHYSMHERRGGAEQACADAGLTLEILTENQKGELAERLEPDTCIVANSIYQAFVARQLAESKRLFPGTDFGLTCCDDMRQVNRWWPQLSRVEFPRFEMGRIGADMCAELIAGTPPRSTLLRCGVIERASCQARTADHLSHS
ncbi:MAG: LacI family DNA-binding transcriptional regulator [Planctomycetota bacterium]|jgi:LacI family transcriptional regulator|nr:LacI family DNA-binding transcriptional regulator [Planctomycetota bacterium]